MTEAEFEVRLRRMIREGRLSPHDEHEGMLLDIDNALEGLEGFTSVRVTRTGDPERMLRARATTACEAEEALRRVREAVLTQIRYGGETIEWGGTEGAGVRVRFATQGYALLMTGEIIVGSARSPG